MRCCVEFNFFIFAQLISIMDEEKKVGQIKYVANEGDQEKVVGLDDDSDLKVTLVSKEGTKFTMARKIALQSQLVKNAVDNEPDEDTHELVLKHIEADIVKRVVQWLTHHDGNPMKVLEKPLRSNDLKDLVDEFDATFADADDNQHTVFKLLLAANYMDIKDLLSLMCGKVATWIKGKTPEEIRTFFNVPKPTQEELEEVKKKYADLIAA